MPLAFESSSHGTIAFGFFNIDSDMLLLEQYFLFGSEFCRYVGDIAENFNDAKYESRWQVYAIEDRVQIGDLMGAIHGIQYSGFIGEVYRKDEIRPRYVQEMKIKIERHRHRLF